MRWWQWAVYALLFVIVVNLFDAGFRALLKSDVKITRFTGKRSDTLIIYLPGLVADGEWSARQLTDTWRRHGDVWLVNPTGDRFRREQIVDTVTDAIEADTHPRVVFWGSSLGADLATDVIAKLTPSKRASIDMVLVPICSPGEGTSTLRRPLRAVSGLAWAFRFGPAMNLTFGKPFTRSITGRQPRTFAMTYYIDQVNYVRTHKMADPALLKDIRTYYFQAKHDEVVAESGAEAWDVGQPFEKIVVDSKHVAYEADPDAWNAAFEALLVHLTDT